MCLPVECSLIIWKLLFTSMRIQSTQSRACVCSCELVGFKHCRTRSPCCQCVVCADAGRCIIHVCMSPVISDNKPDSACDSLFGLVDLQMALWIWLQVVQPLSCTLRSMWTKAKYGSWGLTAPGDKHRGVADYMAASMQRGRCEAWQRQFVGSLVDSRCCVSA